MNKIKLFDKMDKMESKRLKLIKDSLRENVKVKGDDNEANPNEAIEELNVASKVVVKDAFSIMLESNHGGKSTPTLPKKVRKKRIGLRTPNGSSRNDIRKWFGKD